MTSPHPKQDHGIISGWRDPTYPDALGDAVWSAAAPHVTLALLAMRHEGSVRREIGLHPHSGTAPAIRLIAAVIEIPATMPELGPASVGMLKLRAGRILDRICLAAGFPIDRTAEDVVPAADPDCDIGLGYGRMDERAAKNLGCLMHTQAVLDAIFKAICDLPERADDPLRGIDRLLGPRP